MPVRLPLRRRHLLGLVPFAALALARASVLAEGDTFWGIRTGQQIIARHTIHLHDNLSWTRAGVAWHPNEWGYDVALWLAYRAGGLAGVQVFQAATILLLGAVVLLAIRWFRGSVRDTYWLGLFLCPLLLVWVSARAQTVSYSMQLLELMVLARLFTTRARAWWRWAAVLLVLQVFWVNVHEAALSGAGVAAGSAAVRGLTLLRRGSLDVRTAARLAAGPLIVFAGSLCGPSGWSVIANSEQTRTSSAGVIVEWDSIWNGTPTAVGEGVAALILLIAVIHIWRRERGSTREVLSDIWLGAAVVLALASIVVVRFLAPLLLLGIVAAIASLRTERVRDRVAPYRVLLNIGATAVAGILVVVGIIQLSRPGEPTVTNYPTRQLVDAIPAKCTLLNEYGDGGWISLLRWPDLLVSQDGRNVLYGKALLTREESLLDGHQGVAGLAAFGATCVLAKPSDGLVPELAKDPGWMLTGKDSQRVLYVSRAVLTS
ncbi:MAG TPA: hypothetical protein VHB69_07200 [Mycobacteriales bacterium]|nr:hypothetical protein [Mycobacteriales bacterium]